MVAVAHCLTPHHYFFVAAIMVVRSLGIGLHPVSYAVVSLVAMVIAGQVYNRKIKNQ